MRDLKRVLSVDRSSAVRVMPCCLCGEALPHSRVLPDDEARLVFRATVLPSGECWLPVKHADATLCPDPPRSTASKWSDDAWRERYKVAHREAVAARRR